MSKLKPVETIEVKIELDEMDLTIVESKATYEEIKQYVFNNTGLKCTIRKKAIEDALRYFKMM